MSSTPRTATRGGTKKPESGKGHKTDPKKDGLKNSDAKKANPSSERIAKITETATDENSIKQRIKQIMEISMQSEDAVITALHDCDNNAENAITLLLEGGSQGQWETSGKKKKKQAVVSKPDGGTGRGIPDGIEGEDIDSEPLSGNVDRERSRGRGGGAPRGRGRGSGDNRGPGRGRDNKENESGSAGEDGFRGARGDRGDGFRRGGRGMSNGPGTRGGRGGRGGRLGSRMYGGRDGDRRDRDPHRFPSTIDTWNPSEPQEKTEPMKMETWSSFPAAEDWDNEEYTGSLADTKVFTPTAVESAAGGSDAAVDAIVSPAQVQEFHQSTGMPSSPLPVGSGTLNSAQAQYLSQLTQQSAEKSAAAAAAVAYGQAESLKSAVGISTGSFAQSASYGQAVSYGQPNYAPASYGTSSTPYQSSTAAAYAATSAAGTNAFSSSASAPAGSYSATQSAQNSAYSTASAAPASAYPSATGPYQASIQNYQTGTNSSYGYSSAAGTYSNQSYSGSAASFDPSNAASDGTSAQPQRAKTQRPRVPPPSKIPSSAVEMPEDAGVNVASLDVQFGGLEFGSDGVPLDGISAGDSNSVTADSVVSSGGLDATASSQSSMTAYNSKSSVSSQQASLVGGLTGKGLSSNDGLGLQSSEHKNSYNSQSARATSGSTGGLDLTKSDVANLSYASAPSSAANYSAYQNQKSTGYQPTSYSSGSYTASVPPTTYSSVAPNSYSTVSYSNQQSANAFPSPTTYGSQASSTNNYAATGATYPSTNSYPNSSQNYQSSSVYGNYSAGYQNSYSSSSVTGKLNSSLTATKDTELSNSVNLASSTSSTSSTATTNSSTASVTSSLLTSGTNASSTPTTSSSKISTGAMKSSVVPSMHPQMIGTPQYIMSSAGVPFYHQAPVYGYEDVQLHQLQRIPHMTTQYYDMGYSAPTSLAAGRETLPNVAFTMADARYSARADNAASPVPSTLSQQTATGAHQQQMMNHPSFPPGYAYVYNTVPGNFQYASTIFPVPPAGSAHAHATSSNQFAKPGSYGSSYGSGYEALSQTDYNKSQYVSSGVKNAVGPSVTTSSTTSDLYGKAHTALGKVNSYDKQGFHSATPPPFNLATGQGTGMTASGAYAAPQLFIPAIPQHQQHHNLIPSHLQESSSSSGQRSQGTSQAGKSVSKQPYAPYWSGN